MMLRLSFTWHPLAIRALLGGLVLGTALSSGFSNDKSSKSQRAEARSTERVTRSEQQPSATTYAPRSVNSNQSGAGGASSHQKFEPVFNRDTQTGGRRLQPTIERQLNPAASTVSPNGLSHIALRDKGSESQRVNRNSSKGSRTENTAPQKQVQPKIPSNNPPKVVVPKIELPKTEHKTRTPEQPQITLPGKTPKSPTHDSGATGGSIRVRPMPPGKSPVGGDATSGKIKVRTPQPEIKTRVPDIKTPGKSVGNDAGKVVHTPHIDTKIDKPARLKDGATLTREHHDKIRLDLDKQHRDLVKAGKMPDQVKVKLPPQIKLAGRERLEKLPRETLKVAVPKNGKIDPHVAEKLKLRPAHDVLNTRLKNGDFKHLANMKGGQQFQLHKQFEFHQKGDLSRRMNLVSALNHRGGWRHRYFGPISPIYSRHCRSMWYAGPSFCSPYVWYPTWSPWVDWCWWDNCATYYDPRPIYCRPVIYDPCGPWVAWNYPVWQPLPYVTCGTWVDVEPVVINAGMDVQLLATRFVDPGHPEQQLGSRWRMWLRNNTPYDVNQPFNVLLIASTDANAYAGLPEAGVRIQRMRAGETQVVDVRLPYSANTLGRDSSGNAIPFTYLTALVDSHNELPESNKANNGATLLRGDILPVDPSAFAAEPGAAQPSGIMHIAGEGLGPEPGQAMVVIGDQEFQAEIVGWFDLGIQIRLPDFDLDTATAADLVIVRGDGAAANPLTIEIDPAAMIAAAPAASGPSLPEPPQLPMPSF